MIIAFLFYTEHSQFNHPLPLHPDFKHCDYITYDGECWQSFTFGRMGLKVGSPHYCDVDTAIDVMVKLKSVSHIVIVRKTAEHRRKWLPIMVRSCNELARLMTGLNIPFSLTPYGLHKKLLKYDGIRNYRVLKSWSR